VKMGGRGDERVGSMGKLKLGSIGIDFSSSPMVIGEGRNDGAGGGESAKLDTG
jgi:hypothetical protein